MNKYILKMLFKIAQESYCRMKGHYAVGDTTLRGWIESIELCYSGLDYLSIEDIYLSTIIQG